LAELYVQEFKDPSVTLEQIFMVQDMDSAEKLEKNSFGVGALENVGEAGAVPYDDPGLGYSTRYAYQIFKKGIQITREMAQDNQYSEMEDLTKFLAQRASYDPVNYAFGVLRNAFTVNPAGYANFNNGALALCSASQTFENGDAGTQSNLATGVLNYDNFETADVALMEQQSSNGTLVEFTGKNTLVVPPALKRVAIEITDSELDPDTAENAVNVYKGTTDVMVVPFLGAKGGGSDTAWFLVNKAAKLKMKWRNRPMFDDEIDFDTGVLKQSATADYQAGFSDWRAVYGSTGAG
jgi:hypothetical protein